MIFFLKKFYFFFLLAILFFSGASYGFAQTSDTDSISVNELLKTAKQLEHINEHEKAKDICLMLLKKSFDSDVAIFLGKIYTWTDNYDSARIILKTVLDSSKGNYDAVEVLIDLEYWSNNYDASIKYCNIGLAYHPDDNNFLIKKVRALKALNKFDEGELILKNIIQKDSTNQDAIQMLNTLRPDTVSTGWLLAQARQYAYNGKRDTAKAICRNILKKEFDSDASVLLARICMWDDKFDSAAILLNKVLDNNKSHYDALEGMIDLEYLKENYNKSINYCDIGFMYHKDDVNFQIKKARALKALKNIDEASNLLKIVLAKDSTNQDALTLFKSLRPDTASRAWKYQQATNYAFNGERKKASVILSTLLNQSYDPEIAVFYGRILSWDGKYDSSRVIFKMVQDSSKGYYDGFNGFIDLEYWAENYDQSIKICNSGLTFYNNDTIFLLKKAKALRAAKEYEGAKSVLNDILSRDSTNQDALAMLRAIKIDLIKNKIALDYLYEYYSNIFPSFHFAYIQYTRLTPLGSVVARVNWIDRFNTTGLQYEVDAYPSISKKSYIYVNFGYSNKNTIFPLFRNGGEFYHNCKHKWEYSIGYRYLYFSNSVIIYTGSVGKYIGNYWLSFRPFVVPYNTGPTVSDFVLAKKYSVTGMLLARKYFVDADTYLGIRLSYGTSPDDREYYFLQNKYTISYAFRFEWNKKIKDFWIFNIGVKYELDGDYHPAPNGYMIDLSLAKYF